MDYTFIYAGRSRAAMAYVEDLQRLHGENMIIHVDEEGTSLDVNRLIASATDETELYMCGPIRLMDAVRRAWTERELRYPNLRYETFATAAGTTPSATAAGTTQRNSLLRFRRWDWKVTVGPGRSMLEALEDAGADLMFDCRKGECGLCEVRILGLEGAIDHRDVFSSARQQKAAEKMACCVSRAVTSQSGLLREASPSGPAVVTIEVS